MTKTWIELVSQYFEDVIKQFALKIVARGENNVELIGLNFVISISGGPYGAEMLYTDAKNFKMYDLDPFLIVSRGAAKVRVPSETVWEVRVLMELESFSQMLSKDGKDILQGEKGWVKEYRWEPVTLVDPNQRKRITSLIQ